MSEQKWTKKTAQELVPGNLIPGLGKIPFALKVCEVREVDGKMHVKCYKDLYCREPPHEFVMEKDQNVPVARAGVKHMDRITTFEISKTRRRKTPSGGADASK